MKRFVTTLSLFTSLSTLICCALPALLVTLGLGAAMVGLISAVPQLIWLSEHKVLVFGVAGTMLLLSGILQWRARSLSCPTDPALRDSCTRSRKWSVIIYVISIVIYLIGVFFAFAAPIIFE
ncbi:MAG: hypothetical protein COV45_03735 [Deltaproteobacteria bacterium CG11_big_fil_rev_8_21_14_0_20_47_16]|nr:MAG: hypothetical protein COV45_03735 [Deltaproteobacteria bacterium CG11_big_fil_rev_8_21_14_0_20_47_16]